MSDDTIDRLNKKIAELQARRDRLRARERERDRKLDVRRKIILGGTLLALAKHDSAIADQVQKLVDGLENRDAKAFEGWELGEESK